MQNKHLEQATIENLQYFRDELAKNELFPIYWRLDQLTQDLLRNIEALETENESLQLRIAAYENKIEIDDELKKIFIAPNNIAAIEESSNGINFLHLYSGTMIATNKNYNTLKELIFKPKKKDNE